MICRHWRDTLETSCDHFEVISLFDFRPPAVRTDVGESERFGYPVASKAARYELFRRGNVRKVAGRNIDRLHTVSGAKDKPYPFSFEQERNASAFPESQAFVFSAEPALGATYGGYSQTQSEMRGKSQFSRMRNSLPVTEQDIRFLPDFTVCLDEGRDLPK